MTEHVSEICSQCGAGFIPIEGELRSANLCAECQATAETGSFRKPLMTSNDGPLVASTEQRTAFLSGPDADVYSGKTIAKDIDSSATTDPENDSKRSLKAPTKIVSAGRNLGRFEIRGVLGRGSFGLVYRAYDPLLDREVALKIPRFFSDQHDSVKFLNEAKAAAKLKHPNIVVVYECGQIGDQPYIAVELVEGTTLARVLQQRRLSVSESVNLIQQLSEALSYAHSLGIIHRDVKPSNVMIATNGRPQLMDFGLAKHLDAHATDSVDNQILGTPAYMSPEQARGQKAAIGKLSDQYCVGTLFYELLSGSIPYQGDLWSVVTQVSDENVQPTPLLQLQADLPADLVAACQKAMEKRPADRYADLALLAEDMRRWCVGQPLLARPLSKSERLTRWARRNRPLAWSLASLALFLVVVGIFGYILAAHFKELAQQNLISRNKEQASKEAAVAATKQEQKALASEKKTRVDLERLLIENYIESSLVADRAGDPCLSQMWTGYAFDAARNHQDLQYESRQRFHAWNSDLAVPVAAHASSAGWCRALKYHASGRYVLMTGQSTSEIFDIKNQQVMDFPIDANIQVATWNEVGNQLAVARGDTVYVFDFPSGREACCWDLGEPVEDLRFSPDGRRLAVAGQSSIRIDDLTRQHPASPGWQLPKSVNGLIWSPNSKYLGTIGEQEVRVFDVTSTSTEPVMPPLAAQSKNMTRPVFVSNERLVIVDHAAAIRCWDLAKGNMVWDVPCGNVVCVDAEPEQGLVAYGENFEIVLLDAKTGKPCRPRIKHRNIPYHVCFSPDGRTLLSGGGDQTTQLTDVATSQTLIQKVSHPGIVHRVAWAPNGRQFATVEWNRATLRVWRSDRLDRSDVVSSGHAPQAYLRLHSSHHRAISVGFDQPLARRELVQTGLPKGERMGASIRSQGFITDAVYLPDGESLLIAMTQPLESPTLNLDANSKDLAGELQIVHSESGELIGKPLATKSFPIAVDVSPNGQTAAAMCEGGDVLVWALQSQEVHIESNVLEGRPMVHGFMIRHRLRFAPTNDRFVIWGAGAVAEMRSAIDGKLLFRVQHDHNYLHDVVFSPNGDHFVTCGSDQLVRRWNASDGQPLGNNLQHAGWVLTAQHSKDGTKLVTACSDRHARVWDLKTGALLVSTREHADEVYAVTFDTFGNNFYTGCRDGVIRVWDVAKGRQMGPDRRVKGAIHQLTMSFDGSRLWVVGKSADVVGLAINLWHSSMDDPIGRRKIKTLGELISGQSLREGGTPVLLNHEQWMERWQRFNE